MILYTGISIPLTNGIIKKDVIHMKHLDSMFKRVLVTMLLLSAASVSFAQYVDLYERPYNTALGIRVGGTSGVTIKNFYSRKAAFEGIIGTFGNGFSLTGLM